ncbi:protein WVD2-like 7 isoform X2 [Chenopodium quinoa]|uniref:protein WVD2-like 7 isoform X2 n=1 Tax=Chenopodium quinoa TaxID=63459 RepID=UPI000B773EEF|nr:protein WVD2-like 7 isoform X2 [Chenopodium quinoa]
MAESACLRRSFSNPSETSHDFSEGDQVRALGDSISFGRYMSESLAWEKWSTFSHNRYLEEAEKSSKPGSVAKMKAYFEAHYGRIGAKKQAALEQASDDSSFVESEIFSSSSSPALNLDMTVPSSHSTVNELRRSLSSPALNPETALLNSYSTADEFPRNDTPNVEPLSVIVSSCDSSKTKELQNEEDIIVEPSSNIDYKECPEVQVDQCEDAEVNASITENSVEIKVDLSTDALESDTILITPEREVTVTIEEAKTDKLDLRSKQKPTDSSLKSSKKSNVSKLSSSLARLATPVRPKKDCSGTLSTPKLAKESIEMKKSTSKLVQMSINVNSDVKLMNKSSSVSHKTGIEKAFTPLGKMIRQSFVHTPAPSTSRASVNSVSRHPSGTPQTENRRSRIALEKSFARNRSLDQKLHSPSVSTKKSAAQSPITFSPFSFRTEERAVKRREFFERLEKEAENQKMLDKAKVKSKADFRKTSQSVNLSSAAADRREILSDKTKISVARPLPPKCESKTSTNLVGGRSSQPPRSNAGSKPASGNKPIPVMPTKKKRHENASPNIL